MSQSFFKLLYFIVFVTSIAIIGFFLSGQTFVRQSRRSCTNKPNSSFDFTGNMSDQRLTTWPFKMRLSAKSYGRSTPWPNFYVTAENLTDLWYLPPKTRLSPIMRQIGLCELAAKELAAKGIAFDTSNCRCVGSRPGWVIVAISFLALFNFNRLLNGLSIDKVKEKTADDFSGLWLIASVQAVLWAGVTFMLIFYDFGFSYTLYGDMYPLSYYAPSFEWFIIGMLTFVNHCIFTFECIVIGLIWFWSKIGGQQRVRPGTEPKTPKSIPCEIKPSNADAEKPKKMDTGV